MTGTLLAADLHNHTWLSDGEGDPGTAFAQLRAAGLDVAALTDHASVPRHVRDEWRASDVDPLPTWMRTAPASLDVGEWALLEGIADRADDPGVFTAMRGFEWTEPRIGHVNVWFSTGMRHVTTPGNVSGLHDWLAADDLSALFGYNHPGRDAAGSTTFASTRGWCSAWSASRCSTGTTTTSPSASGPGRRPRCWRACARAGDPGSSG